MAVWLAEQVGPTGRVVAIDIDTGYLQRLDMHNLEVLEHNIFTDPLDRLGPGSFDLVCSRLMLFHLAGRQEEAIRQMTECLRPGGWLIDEDADWGDRGARRSFAPTLRRVPARLARRGLAGAVRALRPSGHPP
jgi:SAM-dependent methyltransferase